MEKKHEFEAKQKVPQFPQDAQERIDLTSQRQVPAIRSVQKTVEVPNVQYIDKVADIPVDVQRRGSTIQDTQYISEVEDVPVPTQSIVPRVPDDPCLSETADEDRLEHESKKRRFPMPAEAVSESGADESDIERFDDLVLPSSEGKTLFVSIASGDEAEDEPDKQQDRTLSLAEWAQELLEVRKKFADDVASEMTDVKNKTSSRMSESCSEFWFEENGAPKPGRRLRPHNWTGWSENNSRRMTLSTKPIFRSPLRISRRP